MDKGNNSLIGFVAVSVPISGWWGGSHAVKKRRLNVTMAENDLADNSELLVIRMQKAWADLQDAYFQMIIALKSIGQSEENLRLNEDYYKAGTTTMTDLLDAQSLYRQIRDRFTEAIVAFKLRQLEYLIATGR